MGCANARISLHLLEVFQLIRAGDRVLVSERGQQLLALLALRQPAVARDYVAGVLWPNMNEQSAHGALRTAVWRVQKLCPGLVAVSGDQMALADGIRVDVRELARDVRRLATARVEEADHDLSWPRIRGELMPGLYDDWILLERERIRQLYLHYLEIAAQKLTARRRFAAALEAGLHALEIDPLRESAHRLVMETHLKEGNIREARRQYEICRQLLWKYLLVPPSAATRELVDVPAPA